MYALCNAMMMMLKNTIHLAKNAMYNVYIWLMLNGLHTNRKKMVENHGKHKWTIKMARHFYRLTII